jgi:hypothetical protein
MCIIEMLRYFNGILHNVFAVVKHSSSSERVLRMEHMAKILNDKE